MDRELLLGAEADVESMSIKDVDGSSGDGGTLKEKAELDG